MKSASWRLRGYLLLGLLAFAPFFLYAQPLRLVVSGEHILLNDQPVNIIGFAETGTGSGT